MTMIREVRAFVLHSDAAVRAALCQVLQSCQAIEVIEKSPNGDGTLEQMMALAPDVILVEPDVPSTSTAGVIPEFTIAIARDQDGRPIVNITTFKERDSLGEVLIVGRHGKYRVRALQPGLAGYQVLEDKREELTNAVLLAARGVSPPRPHLSGNSSNGVKPIGGLPPGLPHATNGAKHEAEGGGNPLDPTPARAAVRGSAEQSALPVKPPPRLAPETPKALSQPTRYWDAANSLGEPGPDESWLHLWDKAQLMKEGRKQVLCAVELVFPLPVQIGDVDRFMGRLKRATEAEMNKVAGSLQDGVSVTAGIHRSVPLMEILQSMPEVATAKPTYTPANKLQTSPIFLDASPLLPAKVTITLKGYQEPKQLALAFDNPLTA